MVFAVTTGDGVCRKFIAAFLSVCLTLSNTLSYAAASLSQVNSTPAAVAIPRDLGKIEETFAGHSGKTIIYIQDAHDSLEAQENIAEIIRYYVGRYHVKTVFEEGYEGPVPTDKFFGFIKDLKIRQKVSYFLLDKLRIGGAEYAHINRFALVHSPQTTVDSQTQSQNRGPWTVDRRHDFKLIGIEDLKLYSENIKCYQRSFVNKKNIDEDLGELLGQVTILAQQYFPKEIKFWMKQKELFSEGKLSLPDYLKNLRALYQKDNSTERFAENYPALTMLLIAQTSHDPGLIKQLNTLDSKAVFEGITRLEKNIAGTFLQNERDQNIFAYYQGLSLLKRLNRIELTQAEYEAAQEILQNFNTQKLANFIVSLTQQTLVLSKEWEHSIKEAVRFYSVARKRDEMIDNHLKNFLQNKEEDTAILVFGGFHANAIKEILKRQGFSYIVISPKITSIDKKHQDCYKRLMVKGHLPFEIPFLAARANKPPSIFFSAAAAGEETAIRFELYAIASSVEALGNHFATPLIEEHLSSLSLTQQHHPSQKALSITSARSEIRDGASEDTAKETANEDIVRSVIERERIAASFAALSNIRRLTRTLFVMPMYKEMQRLRPRSAENLLGEDALRVKVSQFEALRSANPNFLWRILAVDDGTPEAASARDVEKIWKEIRAEYQTRGIHLDPDQVRTVIVSPEEKIRTGSRKGYAVVKALKQAVAEEWAEFIGYTDTDISTNVKQTPLLLEKLMKGEADAAIGSRWIVGGEANITLKWRYLSSKLFNLLIKTLLPPLMPIIDTQRGFKLFTRDLLSVILKYEQDPGMSFDTELLLLTKLSGGKIKEIPISWFDSAEASTVVLGEEARRMVIGILKYQFPHLFDIRLYLNLRRDAEVLHDRSIAARRSEARSHNPRVKSRDEVSSVSSEMRMIEPNERRALDEKFHTVANFLSAREVYVSGRNVPIQNQWVGVEIDKLKFAKGEKILFMILGTWEDKVAFEAAPIIRDLRERGYEVKVLTSGKYGNKPGVFFDAQENRLPEAVHYKNILEAKGVTVDFVEPDSTNTGDNIQFSRKKIDQAKYEPNTIIVMQNGLLQKRAGLSIVRQYFGIKDAEEAEEKFKESGIRLISYAPYLPDISREDDKTILRDLEYALTEIKSLQDYPGKGYSIPTNIPPDVLAAADFLGKLLAKIRQRTPAGTVPESLPLLAARTKPVIAIHRGGSPDNGNSQVVSLKAIKRSVELGVDAVEFDVQMTKDGHIISTHAEKLGGKKVGEMTLNEARKIESDLPTIEEVYDAIKDSSARFHIHIVWTEGKNEMLVKTLSDFIKGKGIIKRSLLISFYPGDLLLSEKYLPEAERCLVMFPPVLEKAVSSKGADPLMLVRLAKDAYAQYITWPRQVPVDDDLIKILKANELKIDIGTREKPSLTDVQKYMQSGADILTVISAKEFLGWGNRAEMRLTNPPREIHFEAEIVRKVIQNTQPATVFVDAQDFPNLSLLQKQEFLFVTFSSKALRVVVYDEHGQGQDKELEALLKMNRVQRTDKDLDQAIVDFSRTNIPAIHLSRKLLPSPILVQNFHKTVSFFKTNSPKSGTLATALLWAISGGEAAHFAGVKEENGFWTVEETLLDVIQRSYDNNLVIAVAA